MSPRKCRQPRSGERMQPTAQAVGIETTKSNQPRRGERNDQRNAPASQPDILRIRPQKEVRYCVEARPSCPRGRGPSREAATERSPQPVLSLSKGRKPWVNEVKYHKPRTGERNPPRRIRADCKGRIIVR